MHTEQKLHTSRENPIDKVAISVKSFSLLKKLLRENPELEDIMRSSPNEFQARKRIRGWILPVLKKDAVAYKYYKYEKTGQKAYRKLKWESIAAIRILDYINNAGKKYVDLNQHGKTVFSNPFKMLWLAVNRGTGGGKPDFFRDMLNLFRQLMGTLERKMPSEEELQEWMDRYPSGLDQRVANIRGENRDRIINIFIDKIDSGEIKDNDFYFEKGWSREKKYKKMLEWWDDYRFHLTFAIRSPELLAEMLGNTIDPDIMKRLYRAEKAGIPFFVNPYYLSLLCVTLPEFSIGAGLAIRHYIIYNSQLVDEFGKIVAWEKEDIVEPGKPNAAGWILPSKHSVHRRYPEVAILVPDTTGRACGGLCASCQRMYSFQNGVYNFDLDELEPDAEWPERLESYLEYFENDSQLRDILITGGDALMSSNESLKEILDNVYKMAKKKIEDNKKRNNGNKYAEMIRVRLGTRLPAYLPQRITPELIEILTDFRKKASKAGIKQFVIQAHFESPVEITRITKEKIQALISAGWMVTNQLVFTTAASRRGHTAKLRQVLNEIGVLPYYTFSVKGYMENNFNFATNARSVQEKVEEKVFGLIPDKSRDKIRKLSDDPKNITKKIKQICDTENLPFLATDRNVINLPAVGKSLTFRTIGITRQGRRILEFDHDFTRPHSPIIHKMGKMTIIESKSIFHYLRQIEDRGEDISEYTSIWGYSIGESERRAPIYEYPEYDYKITEEFTNLKI